MGTSGPQASGTAEKSLLGVCYCEFFLKTHCQDHIKFAIFLLCVAISIPKFFKDIIFMSCVLSHDGAMPSLVNDPFMTEIWKVSCLSAFCVTLQVTLGTYILVLLAGYLPNQSSKWETIGSEDGNPFKVVDACLAKSSPES